MSVQVEAEAAVDVALYVYGVVDAGVDRPAAGRGVEGEVAFVDEGPVTALVSRVALTDYGEEPVRARLEDPAWLEEKARAHEAVLERALGAGAVVPFRFLTLYRDEEELRSFLRRESDELGTLLERVRGRVELGVKAFVDRERLAPALAQGHAALAELDESIATAASGRAYLLRRRRDVLVQEESARFLVELARTSHARLSAVAEASASNPPQPRELSGRSEEMVLNGAYLVLADDTRLSAAVAELQAQYGPAGVDFELTGPWPPYNFVPRDLEPA